MTLSISSAMKQMKKCALMRCVSVAAGIGMPRLIYTLGCDSEKKIEQALFFPLILHYLFIK